MVFIESTCQRYQYLTPPAWVLNFHLQNLILRHGEFFKYFQMRTFPETTEIGAAVSVAEIILSLLNTALNLRFKI